MGYINFCKFLKPFRWGKKWSTGTLHRGNSCRGMHICMFVAFSRTEW